MELDNETAQGWGTLTVLLIAGWATCLKPLAFELSARLVPGSEPVVGVDDNE